MGAQRYAGASQIGLGIPLDLDATFRSPRPVARLQSSSPAGSARESSEEVLAHLQSGTVLAIPSLAACESIGAMDGSIIDNINEGSSWIKLDHNVPVDAVEPGPIRRYTWQFANGKRSPGSRR